MRAVFLLCTALLVSGCASVGQGHSSKSKNGGLSDSHSQSVLSILESIHAADLVRRGIHNELRNADIELPEAYVGCIYAQLSDERIVEYMAPIYMRHVSPASTTKLASFFKTDVGQKYAQLVRIGGGEPLTPPVITPEENKPYSDVLPLISLLGTDALGHDLRTGGYSLGLELAAPCVETLTNPSGQPASRTL